MNTNTMSRRHLLASVPALAATAGPAAATALRGLPGGADPIFAVIAEHKAAIEARLIVLDTCDDDSPQRVAALDREENAHTALFTTVPTTIGGVAAWLDHVGSPQYPGEQGCLLTEEFIGSFQDVIAQQVRAVAATLAGAQS